MLIRGALSPSRAGGWWTDPLAQLCSAFDEAPKMVADTWTCENGLKRSAEELLGRPAPRKRRRTEDERWYASFVVQPSGFDGDFTELKARSSKDDRRRSRSPRRRSRSRSRDRDRDRTKDDKDDRDKDKDRDRDRDKDRDRDRDINRDRDRDRDKDTGKDRDRFRDSHRDRDRDRDRDGD